MLKRRRVLRAFLAGASAFTAVAAAWSGGAAGQTFDRRRPRRTTMTAHDFTFAGLEGGDLPLAAWRGKAVLVVNTASFCGFTPQYKDLEAVWRKYKDRGLVVLGVPSNDFGDQEPGSAKEIKAFCETYDVSFPLAAKQVVSGAGAHPFYRWIVAELGEGAAPAWNFHKYLVDRDGLLAGVWPSAVAPTAPPIAAAIEAALKPGA